MLTTRNHFIASIAAAVVCGSAFTAPLFAAPRQAVQQVKIVDEGMCCGGCARKVSGQLYAARGVKDVSADLKSRTLTVSLPAPSQKTLGQLWHAVEKGAGTPTKLVTAEATYTLVRPTAEGSQPNASGSLQIVIDNLHCQACAKKIARQLYAIKGVTKVSADMEKETLIVETNGRGQLSPWAVIAAVSKAGERPVAVVGAHGKLAIEWAQQAPPKTHQPTNHQQAQQPNFGGIQR